MQIVHYELSNRQEMDICKYNLSLLRRAFGLTISMFTYAHLINHNMMNSSIRFLIILILMATVPLLRVCAQQKVSAPAVGLQPKDVGLEPDIATIRIAYSGINLLSLKREAFKFESPDCIEDGLITYFFNNNSILKITESGSIGDGSWVTDYYYSVGKLIFCYDKLTGGPAIGKETTTEYRLYVKNDRPIRCIQNKKIIQPDNKAKETINTAYKLLKAYKTRNFTAALCD